MKMKRQGSSELPRFLVGALATAGASAASGATVQITFANNVVRAATGFANFTPDLTGDGVNDVSGRYFLSGGRLAAGVLVVGATTSMVPFATATANQTGRLVRAFVQGYGTVNGNGFGFLNVRAAPRALVAFSFSDARVNGGGATSGWLDMEATAAADDGGGGASVQIHRLIFDNGSTAAPTGLTSASTGIPAWTAVPEPSGLAMLALGAGGLLARRRRAA